MSCTTATTGTSRSGRRSSGCVPRRIAAPASCRYSLKVEPSEHFLNWQQDPQANYLARLVFPKPARELRIEVDLVAEMAVFNPFDFFLEPYAEKFPFSTSRPSSASWRRFCVTAPGDAAGRRNYLAGIAAEPRATIDFLVELNQRLAARRELPDPHGARRADARRDAALKRSGSCRDSAWLLVQILRHLGLAARFVSGYLIQLAPDVKPLDGPAGPGEDFTDLHAWTEVYLPGAGWIGLDPTSGCSPAKVTFRSRARRSRIRRAGLRRGRGVRDNVRSRHVGRAHLRGAARDQAVHRTRNGRRSMRWASRSMRRSERRRRAPHHGRRADLRLDRRSRSAPEWNTAPSATNKRTHRRGALPAAAGALRAARARCTSDRASGIPGEPLPRWSLNCFWRKDGEPMWNDRALVADETRDVSDAAANAPRILRR